MQRRTTKSFKATNHLIGFTIVELMLVIAVIGIIAGITTVAYKGVTQNAVNKQLLEDIIKASDQLEVDYLDSQVYPATAAASGGNKGLPSTPGTTLSYTVSADQKGYCLQATSTKSGTKSYRIETDDVVKEGTCSGWVWTGGAGAGGGSSTTVVAPTYPTLSYTGGSSGVTLSASGSTCAVGTLQWKLYATRGSGATSSPPNWASLTWQTSNTKSFSFTGTYTGNDVYMWAKPQCTDGTTSVEYSSYAYNAFGPNAGN